MELSPQVEAFHRDLSRAAAVGDADAQAWAERLLQAVDPALRLTLLEVLTTAMAELSDQLGDVTVDVRLVGREPRFVVARATPSSPPPPSEEDSGTARLTVRLPESLKSRAEDAASRAGQSLNTFVVDALRTATQPAPHRRTTGRHVTGWL